MSSAAMEHETTLHDLVPSEVEVARGLKELPDKMAVRREWAHNWVDAWNARDPEAIATLVTDDIIYDDPGMYGELVVGKEHFKANLEMVFRAFPDILFYPSEWPAMFSLDGDHMAAPVQCRTTFSGDLKGGPSKMALAGTNASVDVFCLDLYEFRDDKLCKWTALNQEFALARQAGLLPSNDLLVAVLVRLQRLVAPFMRMRNRTL
jgi:predicted ester cyclase